MLLVSVDKPLVLLWGSSGDLKGPILVIIMDVLGSDTEQ